MESRYTADRRQNNTGIFIGNQYALLRKHIYQYFALMRQINSAQIVYLVISDFFPKTS